MALFVLAPIILVQRTGNKKLSILENHSYSVSPVQSENPFLLSYFGSVARFYCLPRLEADPDFDPTQIPSEFRSIRFSFNAKSLPEQDF